MNYSFITQINGMNMLKEWKKITLKDIRDGLSDEQQKPDQDFTVTNNYLKFNQGEIGSVCIILAIDNSVLLPSTKQSTSIFYFFLVLEVVRFLFICNSFPCALEHLKTTIFCSLFPLHELAENFLNVSSICFQLHQTFSVDSLFQKFIIHATDKRNIPSMKHILQNKTSQ